MPGDAANPAAGRKRFRAGSDLPARHDFGLQPSGHVAEPARARNRRSRGSARPPAAARCSSWSCQVELPALPEAVDLLESSPRNPAPQAPRRGPPRARAPGDDWPPGQAGVRLHDVRAAADGARARLHGFRRPGVLAARPPTRDASRFCTSGGCRGPTRSCSCASAAGSRSRAAAKPLQMTIAARLRIGGRPHP